QFESLIEIGLRLARTIETDAVLLVLDGPTDWAAIRRVANADRVLIAVDDPNDAVGAVDHDFDTVVLDMRDSPIYEKLTQALLESVADEILSPGASVIALYSGFEVGAIDSLSLIHLDE